MKKQETTGEFDSESFKRKSWEEILIESLQSKEGESLDEWCTRMHRKNILMQEAIILQQRDKDKQCQSNIKETQDN